MVKFVICSQPCSKSREEAQSRIFTPKFWQRATARGEGLEGPRFLLVKDPLKSTLSYFGSKIRRFLGSAAQFCWYFAVVCEFLELNLSGTC